MTTGDVHDRHMMQLAFRQALRGWGRCSPNPLVGAVVTDDRGRIVGRGYHHQAGCPHAEPLALDQAGAAARGGVLYVTLEPCSTWGRTPPCTERAIAAGVRRVVIGCLDANPAHRGAAVAILSEAGIEVTTGVLEQACTRLNEAFFWWIKYRRPFVLLKMAMTLDGRIATSGGQSQWITGPPARRFVQRLRRWADAVMAGGGHGAAGQRGPDRPHTGRLASPAVADRVDLAARVPGGGADSVRGSGAAADVCQAVDHAAVAGIPSGPG
jgi:diaminohydroxyphosphoribosylaminopyrimidine deaminase/5-amino-6-(5-phosphoribosylamino)uracil reductase